jgi:hypothetical protein
MRAATAVPDVEISRGARHAMDRHGMRAHDEVQGSRRLKGRQQVPEVFVQAGSLRCG